jgi:hypothetical protein
MKKFYISIFAAVFLLSSFVSHGQRTVYTSILSNPGPTPFTLDDPAFWQGGIPPPNPCHLCDITIWAPVTMAHDGMSSVLGNNGPWLDHVILDSTILRLQPSANVTIDTYVSLTHHTQVFVGTDPAFATAIILNDQVDMDSTSTIQLGNINSYIDANNTSGNNPIKGPYDDFANPGTTIAGIYSILPAPIGGVDYSFTLSGEGVGTVLNNFAFYTINCGGPAGCTFGVINGPALTTPNATFGVVFASSTTLPVQLVQFLASRQDDGSVKLNWATSQEQNSGYFDLERSGDQAEWSKIGSVKAKGYSSTTTNYFYTDRLPLDGDGYYRLKMVDLDGKFKYSKTVSVSTGKNNQALVVYSNPFSDQIRLKVNVSRAQNLTMTVSDMLGRTYLSQSYHAQSGDNFVNLQPAAAGSGMYVLRIHGDSYDQTIKLEKQ